ncbi:hypothetical protein CEXT_55971 [Caerostris extrusa]|uniref:Uncharacterized protein n=1 Tax=Caerostris extrusa TaxID=172846 RepID=A0AAV4M7H1_CAEEX|nr:hypothetical protein CEXT_55971 [Caerostris extrusa]
MTLPILLSAPPWMQSSNPKRKLKAALKSFPGLTMQNLPKNVTDVDAAVLREIYKRGLSQIIAGKEKDCHPRNTWSRRRLIV